MTYFQRKSRETGETFYCIADDAPDWVVDAVRDCHDGELPNDWRYETVAAIFDCVADGWDDSAEIANGLTDIYNSDLLQWLSDNATRADYIDEARAEWLTGDANLIAQVMAGQYLAIEEMASQILAAIEENGVQS